MSKVLDSINNIIKTLQKCKIVSCNGFCFSCKRDISTIEKYPDDSEGEASGFYEK